MLYLFRKAADLAISTRGSNSRGPLGGIIFGMVKSAFISAWNGTLVSDVVQHTLEETSAEKLSAVRLMDLHPTINSSCLRLVISLDENREKGQSSYLPSASTVYRSTQKFQKFCQTLLPTEQIPGVPNSCQFKPDLFLDRFLMTKDLTELLSGPQPSVAINTKCDGFPLMKYQSAVYLVIVLNDPRVCEGNLGISVCS